MIEQELRSLPTNLDAERFVLGSILLDSDAFYLSAASVLLPDDFSLEKHRVIFRRMGELQERGEKIDRITVANELARHNELESIQLSFLISLDDGLPQVPNLDSYIRIVKDKSTLRLIVHAGQNMMNRALVDSESADDILAGANETILRLGVSQTRNTPQTFAEILQGYEGGIDAFMDPSKRTKGISTGFVKLDEMTGGLHAGDLFIIAARPSMGKTALALNIAQHVALKQGKPVVIFSLEMSKESLLTRMLCASARVDSQRFRAGFLSQEERRKLRLALHELVEAPIHVDDTAALTLMDIQSKTKRIIQEQGELPGAVIVDYLQLMSSRGTFSNREGEVSALSRGMKLLAKELGVPVILLAQLSRKCEDRADHRPQLSDLRESGAIEQDADLVGFIFREEVYQRDREDLRGIAELIVAKQRNGPIGTVNLVFLHAQTKFENACYDMPEDGANA